ncbi:unnamed protein product, partial [Prorocentrum cordatum]
GWWDYNLRLVQETANHGPAAWWPHKGAGGPLPGLHGDHHVRRRLQPAVLAERGGLDVDAPDHPGRACAGLSSRYPCPGARRRWQRRPSRPARLPLRSLAAQVGRGGGPDAPVRGVLRDQPEGQGGELAGPGWPGRACEGHPGAEPQPGGRLLQQGRPRHPARAGPRPRAAAAPRRVPLWRRLPRGRVPVLPHVRLAGACRRVPLRRRLLHGRGPVLQQVRLRPRARGDDRRRRGMCGGRQRGRRLARGARGGRPPQGDAALRHVVGRAARCARPLGGGGRRRRSAVCAASGVIRGAGRRRCCLARPVPRASPGGGGERRSSPSPDGPRAGPPPRDFFRGCMRWRRAGAKFRLDPSPASVGPVHMLIYGARGNKGSLEGAKLFALRASRSSFLLPLLLVLLFSLWEGGARARSYSRFA